ncbi:MAG: alpha/beta hydrolase [Bacteroidetes bacterium]|nr:MAG: alpha/beta hydrolase [Bacteroidota bacterium]
MRKDRHGGSTAIPLSRWLLQYSTTKTRTTMTSSVRFCLRLKLVWLVVFLLTAGCHRSVNAQDIEREIFVPSTISPEAQQVLKAMIEAKGYARLVPAADDFDAWRATHDGLEAASKSRSDQAIERNKVNVTEAELGGVPVLDIRPESWTDNGKVLVYTHGGAYTLFSARSTLPSSAQMSRASGLRVISVDYTTAPFAKWQEIQDQVLNVFEALLAEGYSMKDIALYGDSAGGGLATSTVLNLRNQGMGMPAAVVLWAPWVDLSDAGDTAHTLKEADPALSYERLLYESALAFADGLDLTDQRVSPLYADFTDGFSPALIQGGTKEIFLSTAVRLYRKLDEAGQDVTLDIYEGMWHVFQQFPLPESEIALRKSAAFINKHLM